MIVDVLRSAYGQIAGRLLEIGDVEDPGPKSIQDPVSHPDGLASWVDAPGASAAIADQVLPAVLECQADVRIDAPPSAPEEPPQPATNRPVVLRRRPSTTDDELSSPATDLAGRSCCGMGV